MKKRFRQGERVAWVADSGWMGAAVFFVDVLCDWGRMVDAQTDTACCMLCCVRTMVDSIVPYDDDVGATVFS